MKLYTEEQLHNTVIAISNYLDDINLSKAQDNIKKHLKELQPIELPSDEEMEVIAFECLKNGLDSLEEVFYLAGFQTCAQWLKEQILNQNK